MGIPMKRFLIATLAFLNFLCTGAQALKIGVTAGPHADIVNKIKEIAKDQLDIEIIEFNDFVIPNEALANKELDINSFQHEPFLQAQAGSRGFKIKAIARTVVMPLGLYSTKIKSIKELPDGARVAIPNDPSNGGRALLLLATQKVIEVKEGLNLSILDITSNPQNISFIEIEAPLLPPTLKDVDAALINTDWALVSGLDPRTAIIREDENSPYANVLAVRIEDENREDIQKFIKLYQSEAVRDFIKTKYLGAVIPAWEEVK